MTDSADNLRELPSANDVRLTGEDLLEKGAPLLAYDALSEGVTRFPADVRLRQLLALALARTGASQTANAILEQLAREGHADEETLGLLARTHKDLWAESDEAEDRHRHLQLAFDRYQQAHRLCHGYWSGINAATMALLLGDRSTAAALARGVREQCLQILKAAELKAPESGGNPYWVLSTLGEAALILGDLREAEDRYRNAASLGSHRLGDLASTRRNARLILQHLQLDTACLQAWLRIPPVVVFAGHLIDSPARTSPRFPPHLEEPVKAAIRARLDAIQPGFGYASAACGGDILFLESVLAMKGAAHVVLPYNPEQFLKDSVDIVPGADWPARYAAILERVPEVVVASPQPVASGRMSYEYGFRLLDGMAASRADELDTDLVCLAVWDGRPGDGPGGTATAIDHWRAARKRLEVIDLAALLQSHSLPAVVSDPNAPEDDAPDLDPIRPAFQPQIVAMLFADAKGFSKLSEPEIPIFVEHFLGAVARELATSPDPPMFSNTWGDGLYIVFADIRVAGQFALRLCEMVSRTNWTALGLSHDLSLRIGLHAGPAYACVDPVTSRANYVGAHVSRAARIEPITPPGQVYASGAFAALARSADIQEFDCTYVGRMSQAKGYGVFPTYVVQRHRRRRDAA